MWRTILGFDFAGAYTDSVVAAAEARGAPAAEIERIRETAEFLAMYANPLFRLPITSVERSSPRRAGSR